MSPNDLEPKQGKEALLSKLMASQGQGGTMAKHCPGNWYTEHLLVEVPPCTSLSSFYPSAQHGRNPELPLEAS